MKTLADYVANAVENQSTGTYTFALENEDVSLPYAKEHAPFPSVNLSGTRGPSRKVVAGLNRFDVSVFLPDSIQFSETSTVKTALSDRIKILHQSDEIQSDEEQNEVERCDRKYISREQNFLIQWTKYICPPVDSDQLNFDISEQSNVNDPEDWKITFLCDLRIAVLPDTPRLQIKEVICTQKVFEHLQESTFDTVNLTQTDLPKGAVLPVDHVPYHESTFVNQPSNPVSFVPCPSRHKPYGRNAVVTLIGAIAMLSAAVAMTTAPHAHIAIFACGFAALGIAIALSVLAGYLASKWQKQQQAEQLMALRDEKEEGVEMRTQPNSVTSILTS